MQFVKLLAEMGFFFFFWLEQQLHVAEEAIIMDEETDVVWFGQY